jgi:hypothetical protein
MSRLRGAPGSRGQILVIFGLAAVALFAVVALAIDGGRVLMDQRALQNAVDGAALQGASDIGPGADATQIGTGQDDAFLSLEDSLGIDFSNNYSCPGPAWCALGQVGTVGHRLQGGPCAPYACTPTSSTHGPYNLSTAGSNPCCSNWLTNDGAYKVTIRSPYTYSGTTEPEAFMRIHIWHNLPLMVGGSLWPSVDVEAEAIARNYAIPYAIFMFKRNDGTGGGSNGDIITNGGTTITATKRIGTNGTNAISSGSLTFKCTPSPAYGGDIWEWYPNNAGAINAASVQENTCGAPVTPSRDLCLDGSVGPSCTATYLVPPNMHLPPDPSTLGVTYCSALQTVAAAATALVPTQPLDPTWAVCTRYSKVSVGNGTTLYLNPGVYYFEDSANGMGLNDNGSVVTGDCYPVATNFPACDPSVAIAAGICGAAGLAIGFHCSADRDFGALLVFWPGGSDDNCNNQTNNGQIYCKQTNSSGSNNSLQVSGSASIHLTSSPKYHNVAIWVDPNHGNSATNFTNMSQLPGTCNTTACAYQIGCGSHVVQIQGSGTIGVNGAIFAPDDNLLLGGGAAGSGYGQLLGYTLNLNGGVPVNERYNPLALAYSPVLVR